jgi:maltoporin
MTGDDGAWTKMHVNLAYYAAHFAQTTTSPNLTQAYVEMGGFSFDPQTVFFVGEKYNREDIHIMDFKWRDLDGAGFGISNALGGVLDVNVLTNDSSTAGTFTTNTSPTPNWVSIPVNFDVRYKLLPQLQLEGTYAYAKNANKVTADSTTADHGVQGAIVYYWDKFYGLPGWMTVAAQAGNGMFGSQLGSKGAWSQLGQLGSIWTQQDSVAYRLLTSGTGTFGQFEIAGAAWAEYDKATEATWSSAAGKNIDSDPHYVLAAAVRPSYKLTKNVSLEAEAGVAKQDGGGYYWDSSTSTSYQRTGVSYKLTFAPVLALDSSIGVRPQLRAFVTYEGQDASLGSLAGSHLSASDHEVKFGVQTEVWW